MRKMRRLTRQLFFWSEMLGAFYPSKLTYDLMDTFVQQFMQHGLIHGDPHEGNVALSSADEDSEVPTLVMYDLGQVSSTPSKAIFIWSKAC